MQEEKAKVNPFEEQREEALKHYEKASTALNHWSSFVVDAIRTYNPSPAPSKDVKKAAKDWYESNFDFREMHTATEMEQAFIKGAKWTEQGKEAVDKSGLKQLMFENGAPLRLVDKVIDWINQNFGKEATPVDEKFLLHLIDVVWGQANEDESVPSTVWAKEMIEKAKSTYKLKLNV